MKTIKILGTGCPNCIKQEYNVKLALEKSGIIASIEKITDIEEIMSYDVISMPGIVINNKLVSSGKVLEADEIIDLLKNSCCKDGICKEDEEDDCCSDNTCNETDEENKEKGGCCCGGKC